MTDTPTSRDEAIRHLYGLSLQVDGEFCVGHDESRCLEAETRTAFHLLGVTDEEIEAAYEDSDEDQP